MIEIAAPPVAAAQVAARLDPAEGTVWLCSPGPGESQVVRDFVATAPVAVVDGGDTLELSLTWADMRQRWGTKQSDLPIGMGYLSYDLATGWMKVGSDVRATTGWPDCLFRFYDAIWVGDRTDGSARIVAVDEDAAHRFLARLEMPRPATYPVTVGDFVPEDSPDGYARAVGSVIDYLHAGDVYQVNLARRLRAPLQTGGAGDGGLNLASRLSQSTPAAHGLWMPLSDRQFMIGNSPERFVRVDVQADGSRLIETCPIKGTRPRSGDDAAAIASLMASAKDRAEHVMIVDLERNDLGRVCETGSVHVADRARLLTLPTVHHLVSTVRGRLRADVNLPALLQAVFPGGSITGAPKRRAMQVIAELESARRGPYTGATGWLGAAGDLDLAVAIRTAVSDGRSMTLWVGAGIVADSDPQAELAETQDKARAFTQLAHAGV